MNNPVPIETDTLVNAVCAGQGRPVVMIHGLAASLHDWDPYVRALSEAGFRACALDLLGHGESAKPDRRDYTIQAVSEHFERWMESLGLEQPAVLFGHSLGGYVALEYALRYPERVGGLILTAPFYSLNQLPPFLRRTYHRSALNGMLVERTPDWLLRLVIDLTSVMMGRSGGSLHALPEPVRAQTALDYKRSAPGIYHIPGTMRDLLPDVARMRAPTLLLWGTHDQTLAPASFPILRDALPNLRGAYGLRAGHVLHQSHPREVLPFLLDFLAKLD